jgi:hypothetical protein
MRVLDIQQCEEVAGGWNVFVWIAESLAWDALVELYGKLGQAGPNGNENDNGGTSYGIGTYNTLP